MAWNVNLGGVTYTDAMFANFGYTTYFPQMMQAVATIGANAQSILSGVTYGNSFRNRILNGTFSVNQRGYVSGAALGASAYGHDRWRDLTGSAGTSYTYSTVGPDTTINVTAGQLVQVIDGALIEGGQYTLSWLGTLRMSVQYIAPGTSTVTTAASSVASPATVSGVPAGAQIIIATNSTGTLGQVQFEPGPARTAFERRDDELRRCELHFERNTGTANETIGTGYCGGSFVHIVYKFRTRKRAVPSVAIPNPGSFVVYDGASNFVPSGVAFINASPEAINFGLSCSGLTVGRAALVTVSSSANNGVINVSSDL